MIGQGGDALAAARLADDPERLVGRWRSKVTPVDRVDAAGRGRELDLEVARRRGGASSLAVTAGHRRGHVPIVIA